MTVSAASTQSNQTPNDLVTELNSALPSGLASEITAVLKGSQIELKATDPKVNQFQIQIPSGSSATQLGFSNGQRSTAVSSYLPFLNEQMSQLVDFNQLISRLTSALYLSAIVSSTNVPANGQLPAGDASFSIAINGQTAAPVTFSGSATLGNQNLDNLVTNLNTALAAAGLPSRIVAVRSGGQIELQAADPTITQFQIQIPSGSNATQLGFTSGQESTQVFKYTTIQAIAEQLASVTGITKTSSDPNNPLDLQYDPAGQALTIGLNYQDAFQQSIPLSLSTGLGPLAFEGAASANTTATATLNATVGINLRGLQTQLTGTAAAPTNGVLTADAHFALTVGNANPVNIMLPATSTQNNRSLAQLVVQLNAALTAASVSSAISFGQSSQGELTLTDLDGDALRITPPATTLTATGVGPATGVLTSDAALCTGDRQRGAR